MRAGLLSCWLFCSRGGMLPIGIVARRAGARSGDRAGMQVGARALCPLGCMVGGRAVGRARAHARVRALWRSCACVGWCAVVLVVRMVVWRGGGRVGVRTGGWVAGGAAGWRAVVRTCDVRMSECAVGLATRLWVLAVRRMCACGLVGWLYAWSYVLCAGASYGGVVGDGAVGSAGVRVSERARLRACVCVEERASWWAGALSCVCAGAVCRWCACGCAGGCAYVCASGMAGGMCACGLEGGQAEWLVAWHAIVDLCHGW